MGQEIRRCGVPSISMVASTACQGGVCGCGLGLPLGRGCAAAGAAGGGVAASAWCVGLPLCSGEAEWAAWAARAASVA